MSTNEEINVYTIVKVGFWDKQIDHVNVAIDDVRVVLEDAVKCFHPKPNHTGHVARDTKAALDVVMTGL